MDARKRILLAATLLSLAFTLSWAQESRSSRLADTISVTTFQQKNVIGHLGHPLGSVVRVTGTSVDGDETRSKANSGQTLLKIETVNGKQLAKPIYFTFRRAASGIDKPEFGRPFDYYVHEWGAFDGVVEPPKDLGIEYPNIANDGFHYRREITIHKTNID